jgi:hypothetical protein
VPYTVIPPTGNETASSTQELGAADAVADGDFATGVFEPHAVSPTPATISTAPVSPGNHLVGILGTYR